MLALLAASCADERGGDGGDVLAHVGGRKITAADVDARIQEIPELARPEFTTPAGRARLLRQMVEEEVLYRAAVDGGIEREPDVRRLLDASQRQILVQKYLEREQERMARVAEGEVKEFYDKHRDEYRTERMVRVRLLVAKNRRIAKRVREMAEAGQPFEELCGRFSDDAVVTEARGLIPAWVRAGKAVPWLGNIPAFHEAIAGLGKGELSPVFETPLGFHVARVEEVQEAHQRTLDDARADIAARLSRERSTQGLPALLEDLKKRYRVEIAETAGRSAEELFTQAQQFPDPQARVQLWEELIERYPEDAHVVEALFMIGFTKAEELKDREGAEVAFRRVIEEFPDSELAQSARWMLTSGNGEAPPFDEAPSGPPHSEEAAP